MDINNSSILIVDDNSQNIKVLGNILKEKGYNIIIASGGMLAIEYLKKEKVDLIIMDIMMPEIDGIETCSIIKKIDDLKDIPVIFITAFDDTDHQIKAFESGGVDYITKPFHNDIVFARVEAHIRLKKHQEQLVLLNRTKDKFFSIITHDLKNPLIAIHGLLQLIKENILNNSGFDMNRTIDLILDSSTGMMKLINDVYLWARNQQEDLTFTPVRLNLLMLLKNMEHYHHALFNKKNLNMEYNIPEDLEITFDQFMLETIIRNLISNAVKYSHRGGQISIEARTEENETIIKITDNGVGITKTKLEKLFLIEENLTTAGTEGEKGSGFGLILSKDFVEKHNGRIDVESTPGKGSSFIISVPKI